MKRLSIFMLSLFTIGTTVKAQQERAPRFPEWDPKPKMHPIPPAYYREHSVVILESEVRDYKYEGNDITMYSTEHRIIKVLDKMGIESFNQISVPFRNNETRVDSVKARTILPDGTVRNLTYSMLYIGSGQLFFALDGVEKNAEIEILVKYKAISSFFGSKSFQYSVPVLNSFFELNYPKEMTFNTKGYHGYPSGTEEVVGGHKQVKIYVADIPALEDQPYSFYDLYRMRIDYGIDHFTNRGGYQRGDNFTWDKLAKEIYQDFYWDKLPENRIQYYGNDNDRSESDRIATTNISKNLYMIRASDRRATDKFLTSIGINGTESDIVKIRKIEQGIKDNITEYWQLSDDEDEKLDTILLKKSASAKGMVRLFANCFRVAGVKHEIGLVSDRREHSFDAKFVNWAPLDNYVFYFPDFDKYMAPNEQYYRYPQVPASIIGNKGVFCKTNPETEYNVGKDVTEAEAIIRTIPANAFTENKTKANIILDKDLNAEAEISTSYTGYEASELRYKLAKASLEKRKELIEEEVDLVDRPEQLLRYSTANESFDDVYAGKPLVINAEVRVPQLVKKAGELRYLLNVGDVIGNKAHLYDEKERVLPVDLDYPELNRYTVTVTIPEGYKLIDASELRTSVEETDKDNGNTIAYFHSDYTVEGKKLTVRVTESFPKMHYSVRDYQDFRKVVNAAADFNKLSVLLEKDKPKYKPRPKAKATPVAVQAAAAKPAVTKTTVTTKTTKTVTTTKTTAKPTAVLTKTKPAEVKPAPKPKAPEAKPQPAPAKPKIVIPSSNSGYGPQTGNGGKK